MATAFGKEVKHRLIELDRNQAWLIEEIRTRTGKYCDSSLLNRIFRGEVAGSVKEAICEILEIKGEEI